MSGLVVTAKPFCGPFFVYPVQEVVPVTFSHRLTWTKLASASRHCRSKRGSNLEVIGRDTAGNQCVHANLKNHSRPSLFGSELASSMPSLVTGPIPEIAESGVGFCLMISA